MKDNVPANEMEIYRSNFSAAEEICSGWDLTLNLNIDNNGSSYSNKTIEPTGNIYKQSLVILAFFFVITVAIKRRSRQEQL